MKILLYFRRDDEGRIRLIHAYDEHEAQEWRGAAPPSLTKAMNSIDWRAGEASCVVQIDTDDRILREPAEGPPAIFEPPIERFDLVPIDFSSLIPPDPDPEHAPEWRCVRAETMGMMPCSPDRRVHRDPLPPGECGWKQPLRARGGRRIVVGDALRRCTNRNEVRKVLSYEKGTVEIEGLGGLHEDAVRGRWWIVGSDEDPGPES